MSLKETFHTIKYTRIPLKCRKCSKAIYVIEEGEVLYQCSQFGKFSASCESKASERALLKPEEIAKN